MPQTDFSAQVNAWVAQTRQRLDAVFRESAQRVFELAQTPVGAGGSLPVDIGFLRASFRITTGMPTPVDPGATNKERVTMSFSPGPILAELGQTVYGTWTAAYAGAVNYGTSKRRGYHFVEMAAQRWPAIVAQVSSELQQRVTGATP